MKPINEIKMGLVEVAENDSYFPDSSGVPTFDELNAKVLAWICSRLIRWSDSTITGESLYDRVRKGETITFELVEKVR